MSAATSDRPRRIKTTVVGLLAVVAVVALAGCGVSTSGAPVDIGDPASVGGVFTNDTVRQPDGPELANSPAKLVSLYLLAAAGGDNAVPRLREFLTKAASEAWQAPTDAQAQALTIIRITDGPNTRAEVGGIKPVDVSYQVVGTLSDRGLVTEPATDPLSVHHMTFNVKTVADSAPRIDSIEGDEGDDRSLLLTDDALTTYYRPQPIYFWDSTYTRLIPDLRYLPLTLSPGQRAQKIVQWVLDGPSPWLVAPFVQRNLPVGSIIKEGVTNQNGTWIINLSAPSATGGEQAVRRLSYQLQWSLRPTSTSAVALSIEGKIQHIAGSPDDYLRANLTYDQGQVKQRSYDIVDGKVVATPNTTTQPNVLNAKVNTDGGVVRAAVNRAGDGLAVVKAVSDKPLLQIVRDATSPAVDAKISVRRGDIMGRPTWIPGTDVVLVPCAGRLWSVQSNGDAVDVTTPRMAGVTSVSVAPDGRRIAWVEGSDAFVAPLSSDGGKVTIAQNPRPVLAHLLRATAIAWTGEDWLYVVGTTDAGAGAMWRTTVDSVLPENVSNTLLQTKPTDVVALVDGTAQGPGRLLLNTNQGWYTGGAGPAVVREDNTKNPFFVN